MKALQIITVAAVLTGLTSIASAGPGPEFWNRTRAATKAAAPAKAPPAVETTAKSATCSCCAKKV